jgi:hypothetical protein
MSDVQYFVSEKYTPSTLLRRDASGDQAFIDGTWRPTQSIINYMAGHDDFVDGPIDEGAARKLAPAAFS